MSGERPQCAGVWCDDAWPAVQVTAGIDQVSALIDEVGEEVGEGSGQPAAAPTAASGQIYDRAEDWGTGMGDFGSAQLDTADIKAGLGLQCRSHAHHYSILCSVLSVFPRVTCG